MRVWIVFNDEERDLDVLGVFDNPDDAERYAEETKHLVPNGLKYAEYPVPWRLTTTAIWAMSGRLESWSSCGIAA